MLFLRVGVGVGEGTLPRGYLEKNCLGENRMYTPTNTPTKYCINVLIHEMVWGRGSGRT